MISAVFNPQTPDPTEAHLVPPDTDLYSTATATQMVDIPFLKILIELSRDLMSSLQDARLARSLVCV